MPHNKSRPPVCETGWRQGIYHYIQFNKDWRKSQLKNEYCNLYSVDIGAKLVAARTKGHDAYPGDLVILDTGESGHVAKRLFIEDGGEDYSFFTDFVPVCEIVDVYRHVWSKEESDGDS